MATPLVSVEEYLKTSYEPDVEYVDGELEERNVGASLRYTSIESHEGLAYYGLYDTVVGRE